jgi:uncharacterized damage-inducible protein DinB
MLNGMELSDQLVDTWQIHNRIHLYLLDAIAPEALSSPLTKGKGVASQFAHIHNVRLMWLKASAPDLLEGLEKLEDDLTHDRLSASLRASSDAIAALISRTVESGGRVKNFKPHVVGFLGYLISHESHHRGQIEIGLRQVGTPLPDKISYGLWEWGSR